MTIRVVIADDHRVVRDGLCYLLGQEPDVEVVGEAADGTQTMNVVVATRPDVLLLDLYMPGLDGHAVLAALHAAPHRPAVVVLTSATDDEHLVRAVQAGDVLPSENRLGRARHCRCPSRRRRPGQPQS